MGFSTVYQLSKLLNQKNLKTLKLRDDVRKVFNEIKLRRKVKCEKSAGFNKLIGNS